MEDKRTYEWLRNELFRFINGSGLVSIATADDAELKETRDKAKICFDYMTEFLYEQDLLDEFSEWASERAKESKNTHVILVTSGKTAEEKDD